ncbi:hypothetical protein DFH27DRAFT_611646 [Peziza echinospora]|nr:hypothetical protein DFH27DRAFT_611646 [Peziza echinospora]
MMETQSPHMPPSRYKTVRRANPPAQSSTTTAPLSYCPPPMPLQAQNQSPPSANESLARSRSRYRKRPTIDTSSAAVPVPSIPVPPIPRDFSPHHATQSRSISRPPKTPTDKQVDPSRSFTQVPTSPIPVSAIGAHFVPERRINVQVGKETLTVAVPIDTEAVTLAAAVSKLLPEKTIFGASILLESFKGLGLERPVRKYERVRDIMNSWEDDTKNTLILISTLSGGGGLNASDAPTEAPAAQSTWINYMVKPGKWSKRWLTLRDGALWLAKKETAKKDKDFQHLCHLSDFDVYDPNATTQSNVLKCPKRHCFAVKSQQKASLFQNTSDWVHYFSTNDRTIYTTWQSLLRGWRSFYLVQIKGYGLPPPQPEKTASGDEADEQAGRNGDNQTPPQTANSAQPQGSASPGRKKFTPLITEEELAAPPPQMGSLLGRSKSLKASGRHGASTTSPTAPAVPALDGGQVFAPTGLLGRTYTQKIKEMQDADKEQRRNAPPLFTPSSAMANLASGLPVRTNTKSHRRASSVETVSMGFDGLYQHQLHHQNHQADFTTPLSTAAPLTRSKSISKPGQKPLLDFGEGEISTPPLPVPKSRYRSRTLVTNGSTSGPLIANATSPTYDMPPVTTALWNGKPKSRPPTRDASGEHAHALHGGNPFTGVGLLASIPHEGAGAGTTGHGVQKREGASTLLDIRGKSVFAQGSLLAKVEMERGVEGPVIARGEED